MAFRRKTLLLNPVDQNTSQVQDLRRPGTVKPIGVTLPFNNPNGIFNKSFTNRTIIHMQRSINTLFK